MAENYRKKFKEHYGIDFGSDFEVHHIDLDHSNNDIDNLMLLPKKLHHQYHVSLSAFRYGGTKVRFDAKICGNHVSGNAYDLMMIEHLVDALIECNKWYDYKMYLDGYLPNIHGFSIS